MGSTSTQPVTTGTNSFIINLLRRIRSLSKCFLSNSSCSVTVTHPSNKTSFLKKKQKAEKKKLTPHLRSNSRTSTTHSTHGAYAGVSRHLFCIQKLLCHPDPFSFHCCSYPCALVQSGCCYCTNKLKHQRRHHKLLYRHHTVIQHILLRTLSLSLNHNKYCTDYLNQFVHLLYQT